MAKKKSKKIEKITVTEVPLGPTNLELEKRLEVLEKEPTGPSNKKLAKRVEALEARFDKLVTAISKARKVKGI